MLDSLSYSMEPLRSTFSRHELVIPVIHVVRQKLPPLRVRPSHQHRRDSHHIRRKTSGDKCPDKLSCWNQYLTTEMPALLLASKLVLIMDRRCSSLNHSLHQFKRV